MAQVRSERHSPGWHVERIPVERLPQFPILQGVTDGPVHRYLSGNLLNLEGDEVSWSP